MAGSSVVREVKRKSIHVIPGFLAIPFVVWLGRAIALPTALFFFTIYTLNEISLRRGLGWRVPIAYQTYVIMARKSEIEERTFIGTVYFWGLTALIIAVLPSEPAAAAIMISSLGDAAAAIAGKAFPRPSNPVNRRKSLAGSMAMLAVSTVSCMAVGFTLAASLAIALVSTAAEALTRKSVNDEITVPAVAAAASYIAYAATIPL